ncbi:unnamed protein product [Hermetia illucens]|uniref:Peptidase S1 domain-containing protein n=1 Tax=Hermetia illucens TaxID=343691 RepID=A0A7R8YUQ0_HERIL|nr:chymotrypsin-1-like [Hermetia illucens]CAD7085504.1 unnamed protein product [Hermetia illucens]
MRFLLCFVFARALYVACDKVQIISYSIPGEIAKAEQFPYQVGFEYPGNNETRFSGALVSPSHILTVADHIVRNKTLNVYLGAHRFHNFSETGRVNRVVDTDKDVVIFPEYDAERALDNLAIVILQEAVKFSPTIQPVSLPMVRFNSEESYDNEVVWVSGWGEKPPLNKKRKTLHYLNVTVHPYQDCHVNNPIESVQLCLDTSSGRFICSGDAGAPIVLDRGDSRILVGLANRPQRCISEEPQIALRISSYLDWITDNLL